MTEEKGSAITVEEAPQEDAVQDEVVEVSANESKREEVESMLADNTDTEIPVNEEVVKEQADEASVSDESTDEQELSFEDLTKDADDYVKDGKDKRIGKLTAEKYEYQRQIDELKAQLDEVKKITVKPEEGAQEYTRDQLLKAMEEAVRDGDAGLQFQIMEAMQKQAETKVRKELTSREEAQNEASSRINREITDARDTFNYLWNEDTPELYAGAKPELDLTNQNSLLAQTANYLYRLGNDEAKLRYQRVGGVAIAISDALKIILNRRKGSKPKDSEKEALKKQVKKANRGSFIPGSDVVKDEQISVVSKKTKKENFDDEIKRRKSMQRGSVKRN